jgi:pimeloyl-ACP methyl ester carboxylesterase
MIGYCHKPMAAKWAYKFFSEPQKGRYSKNQLPVFLQKATLHIVNCTKTRHNSATYIIDGNQQTILLVHGWESNSGRWAKLLPYLQTSGSTIVAIDAPAHGLSDGKEFSVVHYAKTINEAIKKYKPQVLIGHSIGGTACLLCMHEYKPTSVDKMIILGAPSDMRILLTNYSNLLGLNKNSRRILSQYIEKQFNLLIDDFSAAHFAKSITVKGIIAHDQNDPTISVSEGLKIAENWPAANMIITNTGYHSMHDADLYQQIASFIA